MPAMPRWSAAVKMVIVSEYNATGPLHRLLGPMFSARPVRFVRRYDGEHFTIEEFQKAVHAVENQEGGVD